MLAECYSQTIMKVLRGVVYGWPGLNQSIAITMSAGRSHVHAARACRPAFQIIRCMLLTSW